MTPKGEANGPYVGMTWEAARPLGLPAVSTDGRYVAYWIDQDRGASPMPHYGRKMIVRDLGGVEQDRTFRVLTQEEVLQALPQGESPSPRAVHLSQARLLDLELRVKERVSLANSWLSMRSWSSLSVCTNDNAASELRVGDLHVNAEPLAALGETVISIRHVDRQLLARSDPERADCNGELRLVSVAVAAAPRVVLVEVATIPTGYCYEPHRMHVLALASAVGPQPPANAPAPGPAPYDCQPGHELSDDQRVVLETYQRSDMAVYRIGPADPLNLRAGPGLHTQVITKLPFLFDGLYHTGGACQVDGVVWLEVEHGKDRGWVSERFVSPVSSFEVVEEIAGVPPGSMVAPTLAGLGRRLRDALAREQSALAETTLNVELIGHQEKVGVGQLALYLTPIGSDSSFGVEYFAHALLDGGLWRLEVLELRNICSRGSYEGVCV